MEFPSLSVAKEGWTAKQDGVLKNIQQLIIKNAKIKFQFISRNNDCYYPHIRNAICLVNTRG